MTAHVTVHEAPRPHRGRLLRALRGHAAPRVAHAPRRACAGRTSLRDTARDLPGQGPAKRTVLTKKRGLPHESSPRRPRTRTMQERTACHDASDRLQKTSPRNVASVRGQRPDATSKIAWASPRVECVAHSTKEPAWTASKEPSRCASTAKVNRRLSRCHSVKASFRSASSRSRSATRARPTFSTPSSSARSSTSLVRLAEFAEVDEAKDEAE